MRRSAPLVLTALAALVIAIAWWKPARSVRDEATVAPHPPAASARAEPAAPVDTPAIPALLQEEERLRSWTLEDPDAAAAWAMRLPPNRRLAAASTVLISLAERPDAAVRVARFFCGQDVAFVREHGNTLVTVLTENRMFVPALAFAVAGGPERAQWLGHTFARWAEHDPETAARAALAQAEPDGMPVVAAVWAARDPEGLARFAREIPDAGLRTGIIADALHRWRERDPEAAARWEEGLPPGLRDEVRRALAGSAGEG